ncbi:unnamed protein product, partial [Rhizophagus irregularis]
QDHENKIYEYLYCLGDETRIILKTSRESNFVKSSRVLKDTVVIAYFLEHYSRLCWLDDYCV